MNSADPSIDTCADKCLEDDECLGFYRWETLDKKKTKCKSVESRCCSNTLSSSLCVHGYKLIYTCPNLGVVERDRWGTLRADQLLHCAAHTRACKLRFYTLPFNLLSSYHFRQSPSSLYPSSNLSPFYTLNPSNLSTTGAGLNHIGNDEGILTVRQRREGDTRISLIFLKEHSCNRAPLELLFGID